MKRTARTRRKEGACLEHDVLKEQHAAMLKLVKRILNPHDLHTDAETLIESYEEEARAILRTLNP